MKKNNMLLVLQELQKAFDRKLEANDYLDQKLQSILDFSSVIVAIVSAITASVLLDKVGILYWIGLLLVMGVYMITFFETKKGLASSSHTNPIGTDLDELKSLCINVKEEKALDVLIKSHLFVMDIEGVINKRKDDSLKTSSNLMFLTVILLFISIVFGLAFPHLKLDDLTQTILNILKVKL